MATTYMDYEALAKISDGLKQMGNFLKNVNNIMRAGVETLKTTAFIGLVGGYAVINHYEQCIRPRIEEVIAICYEMCNDLRSSITTQAQKDGEMVPTFQD